MDLGDDRPIQAILQKKDNIKEGEDELMDKPSDGMIRLEVKKEEEKEEEGKDKKEEEMMDKKEKEGMDKKGVTERSAKEKKGDRPQTEEEVLAEIGRKKAATQEKAAKMKERRKEEMERKREEKKEEMERKKEEKERKKEEREREREEKRRRKEMAKELQVNRKPKSRAESSRRTKSLLASREGDNSSDGEEEEEPKEKKRKYVRKTAGARKVKKGAEEGGGKYLANPCEYYMENVCTETPLEEFSDEEMDPVISVPALWTNEQDKLPEGTMGPVNYDDDASMKKHLRDMEEVYEPLSVEYRNAINKLDGMKLNLFGETIFRKFDPRVIHNIDNPSTESTWPVDMCPRPNVSIPKYRSLVWKFSAERPFPGLIRVRPLHKAKDVLTSHDIDVMSGCVVPVVTKRDIERNVDQLILSKLRKDDSWRPVPSVKNPFDVPEVATRKRGLGNVKDAWRASYVDKKSCEKSPDDGTMERKSMRELLMENAQSTTTGEERQGKYKDAMEGEGEKDEEECKANETGEMVDDPSRAIGEMPLEGMEYHHGMN